MQLAQEGSSWELSCRLDTKGLPRYLSLCVSLTPLNVILIPCERSWRQAKKDCWWLPSLFCYSDQVLLPSCSRFPVAPGSQLLQVPSCSRKSCVCLLVVKGGSYRVTAEPQCSTCGSNPAHLLRLFTTETCQIQ